MHFNLILLLFYFTIYCNGFAINDSLKIKYFTLEDGLSQVSSNDLLLDSSGFVWIATADGLNRFDGKIFKHFKYNESDSTTISGNFINKLLEDKTNKIWVGTNGNGLSYYDNATETFHRIKLKYSQGENEIISSLAEDNFGDIWVTSKNSGLHRISHLKDNSFIQENYLSNQSLSASLYDQNKNLWVGSFNGNVFKLDAFDKKSFQREPELTIKGEVLAFYNTGKQLLIGTDLGLSIYDLQRKKIQLIELDDTGNHTTRFVSSFLKAEKSLVWIGTGSGLYLFDWARKVVIKKIKYSDNKNDGLSNNTVLALLKISTHKIFVGTANYLNLLDFKTPPFKNISQNKKGEHLLNDNVIFSIFKEEKDLWIGTSNGGLNLIQNGSVFYFKENQNDPNSISGSVVRAIVKDEKNQRLWLATSRGLSMIDLHTFDPYHPIFRVFHHNPNNPNTINMDFIKDIALDKNGDLWGATFGYGIFRLKMSAKNDVEIIRYKNEKDNPNSLRNDVAQCIRIDNKNNIWIGTQEGLIKLNFKNNDYNNPVFTSYYKTFNQNTSLSNNSVYDILIDKEERIWIGTRYGLNLLLDNGEFESWNKQKQFPNSIIYSIQDDEFGNLWLGTNDGIVRFDTTNRSFKHYSEHDGIQSKEFDIHAKFRDKMNNIYLGGIGGVTYFNPKDLESIDHPQPLYFSQIRVKDQVRNPIKLTNNLLNRAISKTNKLEFKHNQFPFYLQFSSIDYRLNKNVEYAYKLLPSDEEWNVLTDLEIQFLNLPSGSYTLQVNGFSRGKEWEQLPLEMDIEILPPWWSTWWAYIIYLGIAVLFADRFYRFQLSKRLAIEESERLKEVNQLKNSLYTNITHEFRTPLTVILGMADSLKSNVEGNHLEGVEKSIEMIQRNGKNLLNLVNEMLDLSKLESGKMELQLVQTDVIPLVKYLCESFQSLAEETQISLMVYSEIDELIMDIDTNKLSAIISNILSNAIKFTLPNGKIIVHINRISKKGNKFLFAKIKDNGLGISKDEIPNIFNRFYQIDNSASRKNGGSGIGLSLSKEFIKLMGGTISVKSKYGKGSEFTILIPISRNAVKEKDIHPPVNIYIPSSSVIAESFKEIPENNSELPLVLIIEDNDDVAHYLKTCLKGKYQTLHAANGIIGVEMAYEKIPDIIICDIMMPGKDGLEACSDLKTDERTDHIPVIFLTAKTGIKDRLAGLSHGADAYLTKPFVKEELFTRLDQLVLLRKKMMDKIENDSFNHFMNMRAENPETRFAQKAVKMILEELSDHSFGSAHLAHKLHLSESQIYRKLKAITGKSTAVFIRSVRLNHAKELIQNTDKTISEIAYDVGFNDPSWFSRAFKEEFGFAPSAMHK